MLCTIQFSCISRYDVQCPKLNTKHVGQSKKVGSKNTFLSLTEDQKGEVYCSCRSIDLNPEGGIN